ncbi:MAG: uracil-DNA glycosylase [Archangiaceae bacterium]|nr:uracil-DNA glycosylase [Archangiaceae bacterium]
MVFQALRKKDLAARSATGRVSENPLGCAAGFFSYPARALTALENLHAELRACRRCPAMSGPVIHGPALRTDVMLVGQAPGPHEHKVMKPFGWTAGKTLFKWFEQSLGWSEDDFRARIYIAAVARCFPGKAVNGGGDRKPDETEMANCRPWLEREVKLLRPKLIIPVGALAIEQVLQRKGPLVDFIGRPLKATWHGIEVEVVALPHPSGASTWHRTEPGIGLLKQAMKLLKARLACRF